ncbi:outer membrane lipoprotein carrier protein LolA [Microvirga tunisiensis]|uniref:Outer membrane lipoprotein carrier protein LolA n=2 Tax=Pannonibacter tanglangensis TaxID=2750084 RepID=A0ABW9ZN24_9HYPH|nr:MULTISPECIES: outer-membrane lipoprotein carrier protein LolA [unclassified Pannonibacter]NBN65503.1 outer membrane lipoprotein carrier protein LolA [Pannonibacter sp. XCT-34]NBN80270.1 outer membrane lipoprotein carrier protein LolA [Pannonibacter sp. XCT-53]
MTYPRLPRLRTRIADRIVAPLAVPLAALVLAVATALAVPAPVQAAGTPAAQLTPTEQETLNEINTYFNSVRTMHGEFVQFGPEGDQVEGKFFLERPGKIRFYYNPPVQLDIIADGKSVSVKDRKLATQDIWPLNETPLRFLLAEQIDLTKDANVVGVVVESDLVTVVVEDRTTFNSGKLTLIFDAQTFDLKQWTVTDAQGLDTSVAIYNITANGPSNPKLFVIDYLANARQNSPN